LKAGTRANDDLDAAIAGLDALAEKAEEFKETMRRLHASQAAALNMMEDSEESRKETERAREELKKINKDLETTQNASLNIMADLDRQRKELDKSLQEKEALIREVHHRVKNNMQVISSLLKLQSFHIEDPALKAIFKDSENRISSMAKVHERLYRTEDLAHIDFGDYINSLAIDIFHSFGAKASNIRLRVDVEDVALPIDTAIPCGLIINELITNAIKYAFPDDRKGELVIEMRRITISDLGSGNADLKSPIPDPKFGGQSEIRNPKSQIEIELIVRDNGVGIPEGLDWKTSKTLGLNLVTSLTKQIRGEIELNRENGTGWRIGFGIAECGFGV
jgi:two-component sensor histidine kinase